MTDKYEIDLAISKDAFPAFVDAVNQNGSDDLALWLASTKGRLTPDVLLTVSNSYFDHVRAELNQILDEVGEENFQLVTINPDANMDTFIEYRGEDFGAGEYYLQLHSQDEFDGANWIAATPMQRSNIIDTVVGTANKWASQEGKEPISHDFIRGLKRMVGGPTNTALSASGVLPMLMLKVIDGNIPSQFRVFEKEMEKLRDPDVNMKLLLADRLDQMESSAVGMR